MDLSVDGSITWWYYCETLETFRGGALLEEVGHWRCVLGGGGHVSSEFLSSSSSPPILLLSTVRWVDLATRCHLPLLRHRPLGPAGLQPRSLRPWATVSTPILLFDSFFVKGTERSTNMHAVKRIFKSPECGRNLLRFRYSSLNWGVLWTSFGENYFFSLSRHLTFWATLLGWANHLAKGHPSGRRICVKPH